MPHYPTLLILLDGVADRPVSELGHRTPLQAARTPTLDRLASRGRCGVADPVGPGIIPSTTSGTLGVMGYDPLKFKVGRGVVEAAGVGLPVAAGDIALRGNWAWIREDGMVADRRAGRIREGTGELVEALSAIRLEQPYRIRLGAGTEHRLALVLSGHGLSDQIVGSDPTDAHPHGSRITPHAINRECAEASLTARLLDQFECRAREILEDHPLNQARISRGLPPANGILTRGPGKSVPLPSIRMHGRRARALCITGDRTVVGLARMTGMASITSPGMTANLVTDLHEKVRVAINHLDDYLLVLVHIKGCDIAAHNRQAREKRDFIEKIDRALAWFLENWGKEIRIGITADHATWSETGSHIADPVPALLYGSGIGADAVKGWNEVEAASGDLGRIPMHRFLDHFPVLAGDTDVIEFLEDAVN